MNLPYDRDIAAWLAEGPDQGPLEPLDRALATTRRTTKRPRWSFPERWLPMQLTIQRPLVPRSLVSLAVLGLLTAGLALAVLLLSGAPTPAPLGVANGWIAYDAGGQIYLAEPDGSDPRPIAQPGKYAYSPTFSPDGSRLAYLSNDEVGQLQLYVAGADGSGPIQVSAVSAGGGRTRFPASWSPDGSRLAHYGSDGGIWVMAADGSAQARIADGWSVDWSPDGEWIAFRSDGDGEARLRIIRPDGSDARTLATADVASDSFAVVRWLPDSSRIAFHRGGVFTVDLKGNEAQLSAEGGYPTVSPDGRYVAFLQEVADGEVVRLAELATGTVTTLGPGGCLAVWAPDSTAILTYANGCFADIQRIPLDDPSAAETIAVPQGADGFPGWQALPASAAPTSED
jgi:dipeptidyl aminopeptidase/acylaminoacyl peptidase